MRGCLRRMQTTNPVTQKTKRPVSGSCPSTPAGRLADAATGCPQGTCCPPYAAAFVGPEYLSWPGQILGCCGPI
jgi:hypothetical protein